MSDAAARRRERILAASRSRMQMVGGGTLVEEKPVRSEGVDEGESTAASTSGSSSGSNQARNRRLQSRNITIAPEVAATETSTSTEEAEEGAAPATATAPAPAPDVPLEKEEKDESEVTTVTSTTDASAAAAAPTIVPLPTAAEAVATLDADQSSSSSALHSVAFTTGGNALRRRFQASRAANANLGDVMAGKEEGGVAGEIEKGKLMKEQPQLPSPSLMAMLISSEALVRFWLLCVAGVSAGAWVVQQNAEMLLRHKEQQAESEAVVTTTTSASRAALDDFLALNGVDGSEGLGAAGGTKEGSTKAIGLWNWVYGLFLPEIFDSLPLPFMAVLWHAIIVVGVLTLRTVGSKAGQHQRRPSMVNITGVEQEGEGTELIPKDDQQQQQAPVANAGNKSFFETMAHSLGLGPLLTAFNLAQTVWQELLIFSFFFLLTVAAHS